MDLHGKVIVITGAAQGLDQNMAELVAAESAKLALVDLDDAKLQDTVRLCTKAAGKAKDYPADVTDEPAVEALFNAVHRDFGSVDGLINNAGITSDVLPVKAADGKVQKKMSLFDFHRAIAVELEGGVFVRPQGRGANGRERPRRRHHQHFQHFARRQCRTDQLRRSQSRRRRHDRDLGQGTGALPHPRRRHRVDAGGCALTPLRRTE